MSFTGHVFSINRTLLSNSNVLILPTSSHKMPPSCSGLPNWWNKFLRYPTIIRIIRIIIASLPHKSRRQWRNSWDASGKNWTTPTKSAIYNCLRVCMAWIIQIWRIPSNNNTTRSPALRSKSWFLASTRNTAPTK